MCVSIIHIRSLVHELQSKQVFYELAYLALTLDLVTLSSSQLQHLSDTNHVCKYHSYPIIGSRITVKTLFFYNLAYLTLTFGLVTLIVVQLQHLININFLCEYHYCSIVLPWYICIPYIYIFFNNFFILTSG